LRSTATALGDTGQQIMKVHRIAAEGQPLLVGGCQQQQFFGQSGEAVRLLSDRCHGCPKIIVFRRTGLREVNLGLDDRQRRTQLVAGVGEEPSLLQQGVLLRGLGAPDPVEHVAQGAAEAPDLVIDR